MRVFFALTRKHLHESRWVLGLMSAALLLMAFLWTFGVARAEKRVAKNPMVGAQARELRPYAALGGSAMDFSTQAMAAAVWNHPVTILMILGWTISRASAAVAAEVERGTLDLTLSRPVRRGTYLASQVICGVLGIVVLAAAVIGGELLGWKYFHIQASPTLAGLLRPAAMYVAFGMAIYGYSLPMSALDSVRWRASIFGVAVTLGGLICMILGWQLDGYDWLEKLSVFQVYAPVTAAMKGDPLAYNGGVLSAIFAAGVVLSMLVFSYRDLPANS